jgi:nucleotide-binding universal stress UspA family protein
MDQVVTRIDATGGILVGHDGSHPSAQAVRWAAGLAGRLGVPLHVVRTWALSSAPRPKTWRTGFVPPLKDFEATVLERLQHDVDVLHLSDVEVACHVLHGSAARRLVESSDGAEMLVVGSRGVGGFMGVVIGSTALQVAGHAKCPVVVVPVHGDDNPAEPDAGLRVRSRSDDTAGVDAD